MEKRIQLARGTIRRCVAELKNLGFKEIRSKKAITNLGLEYDKHARIWYLKTSDSEFVFVLYKDTNVWYLYGHGIQKKYVVTEVLSARFHGPDFEEFMKLHRSSLKLKEVTHA